MKPKFLLTSFLFFSFTLTGCQMGYIASSAWKQNRLYSKRVEIPKVIADPKTTPEVKRKLELVLAARKFAEEELHLKPTKNYTQFVALDRPYVSYIVHAAPAFKLESYRWWFPIVGHVPYKGYFSKTEADDEAKTFDPEKYDTFVRGVTAYSTLGWFTDPVFSSMLGYSDSDLVNTVIHETVHATIFIKDKADFNEKLATFLGDFGTELFYLKREGEQSKTLKDVALEQHDQKLFSDFLSKEMSDLRKWYEGQKDPTQEDKRARLDAIALRFRSEIVPKLKTKSFQNFGQEPLNNARLLSIGTYLEDLSDFQKLRVKLGEYQKILDYLKTLKKDKNPEKTLKDYVAS